MTPKPTMRGSFDVHRWRREFEIPRKVVFLNNASFGPVPRRGRVAVESLFQRQGRFLDEPVVDSETFARLEASRKKFALLTGADSRRVAFVPNASYGLNAVLWGLGLKPGERVLVPANEFPAIVYAVRSIAEKLRLEMVSIPCPDGHMDFGSLDRELQKGAAALATSWVQFFNGYRNDLSSLIDRCHRYGCFLLADLSQGAGSVPLNIRRYGVDAIACGAQKWLLGQTGAGFFAISPDPIRPVRPLYAGWLGYDWGYTWGDLQRWDRPAHRDSRVWEVGTYPFYSVRLADAGLSLLTECGIPAVYRHIQSLHRRLIDGLVESRYTPNQFPDPKNRSAIISLAGPKTRALHALLEAKRIYVSLREGNIRVSPHFYNTEEEIGRLVATIRAFEKSG